VETVYPELVRTDRIGYKSVNYMGLIPLLLENVKAQQKEMDKMRLVIQKLNERIEKLENER